MEKGKVKLRIGVLTDSMELENWALKMLERIQRSSYAEIKLIVLNDTPQSHKNIFQRALTNPHLILYRLYTRLDRRLFKQDPNAFEILDAGKLFAGIPVLKVRPKQTQLSDRLIDEDIDKIKQHDVDLFIRLGFRILRGEILSVARYGVWSYHHGDNFVNRGGPPGFWEVFDNYPITGSILQILTEDLDNGRVLCRSWSATDHLSVHRNGNNYFWKSLSFFPRKLQELYDKGEKEFFKQVDSQNQDPTMYSHRLYLAPSNLTMIKIFMKHLVRYIAFKWKEIISFEQWILLYDIRKGMSTSFWRFKKILPPKDRFWADPFLVNKEDTYYIFMEEYLYKPQKGHIAVLTMDSKGNYSGSKPVLKRPYHLSYPFLMEWKGDLYMIPESLDNRTLEVYKCTEFPHQWEFYKTIMDDIAAGDATLFYYENKWWLFTMIRENEGGPDWDELFLYYADEPFSSDYKSHPMNPIRSDVRNSRPAGKIIEHMGNLYRIAQHSSRKGYGYGLKINRIITLNETEYEERELQSLDPSWDRKIIGIHTFNHENRLTIIDGKIRRSRLF